MSEPNYAEWLSLCRTLLLSSHEDNFADLNSNYRKFQEKFSPSIFSSQNYIDQLAAAVLLRVNVETEMLINFILICIFQIHCGKNADHLQQMKQCIAQSEKFYPNNLVFKLLVKFKQSTIFNIERQYKDELELLNEVIQLSNSRFSPALNNRANSYRDLFFEYDKSLADYNTAIQLVQTDALYYRNRGNLLQENLKKYDLAILDLNKAIELDPTDFKAYTSRAVYYERLGQSDVALTNYKKALELDAKGDDGWVYNNLAIMYENTKEMDVILGYYDKAIEANPKESTFFLNRGNYYLFELGNYDLALNDFDTVLNTIDSTCIDALIGKGITLNSLEGRTQEAMTIFQESIQLAKDKLYRRSNSNPIDTEAVKNSLVEALLNMGYCYAEEEQFDDAESVISEALVLDPTDLDGLYARAKLYECNLNLHTKAFEDYSAMLQIDPNNDVARCNRALLFVVYNQIERAHIEMHKLQFNDTASIPHLIRSKNRVFQKDCYDEVYLRNTKGLHVDVLAMITDGFRLLIDNAMDIEDFDSAQHFAENF